MIGILLAVFLFVVIIIIAGGSKAGSYKGQRPSTPKPTKRKFNETRK